MNALAISLAAFVITADSQAPSAPAELKKFNSLIGEWKATGSPTRQPGEARPEFWTEAIRWEWRFGKDDASLVCTVDNGKFFKKADLHYNRQAKKYELLLTTPGKESLKYEGSLTEEGRRSPVLTLEHVDPDTKAVKQIIITLLHSNRYLYQIETQPEGSSRVQVIAKVGATKQGVPFASANRGPECIVSGGLGTIKVSYQGKDYFVCCSGCKDAFLDDPEQFIADAAKPKD